MSLTVAVNLLFLTPGRKSGTATYAWSLLNEWRDAQGLSFILFVQDGWTPWPDRPANMRFERCPRFRGRLGRVWWEQMKLTRRAAALGADVVFSPGYVGPLSARLPQVVTVHDMYYVRCPDDLPAGQRRYWRFFIPRSVRRAARVIAVSDTTRRDLEAAVPAARGKTVTVYEAPRAVGAAPPQAAMDGPYFLTLAFMTPNKSPDTLVQAIMALRETHRDARLVVAGDDPTGLLAAAILRHAAQAAVTFVSAPEDEALAALLGHATAFVTASSYEGFGLPPLEAQAMGVAVIASRGGALPEVLGEGALYADHREPRSFAAAMARLLDDPDVRTQLIAAGKANQARFSWARAAAETEAVLRAAAAA